MAGVELVGGAFLGAAFQVVLERLASADFKRYFRGKKHMEDLLKKLEITLLSVNIVLEDAEEKQYSNSKVKLWLDELKDAAYIADDLLDEIAYEATHQKLEIESQTATAKVRGFFTSLVNQFDTQIEGRIQQVLDHLEFLAMQKNEFRLKESSGGAKFKGKMSNKLPSTSLLSETTICGRDVDKEKIIKFLGSDSDASGRRVSIVCILGMGGLGKTTLAQLVYNDPRMEEQFQLKAWVCVSEDFDVQRLTKTILSALECSTTGNEDLNQLQLKLKGKLKDKKFLLVLDDVWNQDPTLWEILQAPFLCGASGSKVVITTRNREVALVMQAKVHPLQLLEKEDGWKLFEKYAFNDKDAAMNTNLEPLGRKIVDKCKGLPLAIKSLGALVGRELSEQRWGEILESDIWQLPDDKSNIIPALRLSYHYLPSHLKRCFAFCSIFPKDCRIFKPNIIRLWMAEGLLDCRQGTKSKEELGDEFFNDLESRSFFEEGPHSPCFVMHDLVNDLAKSVSGDFCVRIEEDKVPDIPTKARYISYCQSIQYISGNVQHLYQSKQLRMLMQFNTFHKQFNTFHEQFNTFHEYEVKVCLLSRWKYLRILSLRACENIIELDDDISNLKHLRYLDLSQTKIKCFPHSICTLHNLQTLLLHDCSFLVELPSNMHQLINLRHLSLSQTKIKCLPHSICTLHNLQTLVLFKCLFLVELPPNMHQLINLHYLCLVGSKISKLPDSICELHNLHTLNLQFCKCLDELPKDFRKLTNLRHLDLHGTKIRATPEYLKMLKCYQSTTIYVEKHSGSSIKELGTLSKLRGHLSISQLENISDAMDAKEAKMRDQECLDRLELEWKEHEDSQNERSVLEAFQPHVNLEELHIRNYGGSSFVDWFDAPYLPNLVTLKLSGCKYCFSLPPLGQLPSLKILVIIELEGIRKIGAEFYGNNSSTTAFRSLEYLYFSGMNEWEEWTHFEGECFLCLQGLRLELCSRLTMSLPPYLTSLRSLKIHGCQELEPSLPKESWAKECWMQQILVTNPNLERLHLKNCPKLVSFPTYEISAPKLEGLSIGNWRRQDSLPDSMQAQLPIRSLWFRSCPHLIKLSLSNCPKLESFDKEGLPSTLSSLTIKHCPKLIACSKEWGLSGLHSLRRLNIVGGDFENVESFPEESLLPPNLTHLSFERCSNLKTINYKGLLHLTYLISLTISHCPKLIVCPKELGLCKLHSLRSLTIGGDFENVESFPEESLLPPNVFVLSFEGCSNLKTINYKGLLHLTHLGFLRIRDCPSLQCLPEEVLPNLQRLQIVGDCPMLKQRYQKENGQDWHKISHIPLVFID